MLRLFVFLAMAALAPTGGAQAQDLQIRLGQSLNLTQSALEITSETLEVDQSSGASVFSGGVVAVQGEFRLTSDSLRIEYQTTGGDGRQRIDRLIASGGVTVVTPTEAAEARTAVYSLSAETLEMQGDVVLVQGQNVLSGEQLSVNLRDGTGRLSGRVRTIIQFDQ